MGKKRTLRVAARPLLFRIMPTLDPTPEQGAHEAAAVKRDHAPRRSRERWLTGSALVAIVVVAVIPRVLALSALGLNSDEAVYTGQAATLAGDAGFAAQFSLFRAHPLLVQFVLSLVFRLGGVDDTMARWVVTVVFGVGCVVAAYSLARRLYGRLVAAVTALVLAVMPYHVLISRQVLLDVPMTLFAILAFLAAHRWKNTGRVAWLAAAGVATGAATLSKEAGLLVGLVLLVYLLATRALPRRAVQALTSYGVGFLVIVSPFLVSRLIRASNVSTTVLWQFGRAPNHTADYYPRVLAQYVGIPVLVLATVGLAVMVIRHSAEDWLVLSWLVVMGAFFQLWPTKLVSYLIVLTPPLAMAAAVGLDQLATALGRRLRRIGPPSVVAAVATCVVTGAVTIHSADASLQLARHGPARAGQLGDFGVTVATFAGGREVAEWAEDTTPPNGRFLTLGPSMGNIISFYSQRSFVALSVSPDPRRRNPAYVPVPNPDLALRVSALDYMVWDAYSARRSAFTSDRFLRYAHTYRAVPVFAVWGDDEYDLQTGPAAPPGIEPRIVVYVVTAASPRLNADGGSR